MDVNITITAPEGIRDFVIDVDSATLGDVIAGMGGEKNADGTVKMDLINNEKLVSTLGSNPLNVPTGDKLKDQTKVDFSLSSLVPMILLYPATSGDKHTFTLKVTDNKDQSLEKAIVFYVE